MAVNLSTAQSSKKMKKGVIVKRITTTTIVEEVLVNQSGQNIVGTHLVNPLKSIKDMSSKKIRKLSNASSTEKAKNSKWVESDSEDNATDDECGGNKRKISNRQKSTKPKELNKIIFTKNSQHAQDDTNIDDIMKQALDEFKQIPVNNNVTQHNVQQQPNDGLSIILETTEIDNTIYQNQNIDSPKNEFQQKVNDSLEKKTNKKKSINKKSKTDQSRKDISNDVITEMDRYDQINEEINKAPPSELIESSNMRETSKEQSTERLLLPETSARRSVRRKTAIAACTKILSATEAIAKAISITKKTKSKSVSDKVSETLSDPVTSVVSEVSPSDPDKNEKAKAKKTSPKKPSTKTRKIRKEENQLVPDNKENVEKLEASTVPLSTIESGISVQEATSASMITENSNLNADIEKTSDKQHLTRSRRKEKQEKGTKSSSDSIVEPEAFSVPAKITIATKAVKKAKIKSTTEKSSPKISTTITRKNKKEESPPEIEKNVGNVNNTSNGRSDYSQASTVPLSPNHSNVSLPNISRASTSTTGRTGGIVIYSPSMANKFKRKRSSDKIKLTKKNFMDAIKSSNSIVTKSVNIPAIEIESNQKLTYHPHQGDITSAIKEAKETGKDIFSILRNVRKSYLAIQDE